jgi:mRNA interferase MazF
MKRSEIWLVNLDPTIGREIRKTRPAVIIQNDIGNKFSAMVIVAPVTSKRLDKISPVEVYLPKKDAEIKKNSKILLNQIRSVDKIRLVKKIGKVNPRLMKKVNESLKISLGLIEL